MGENQYQALRRQVDDLRKMQADDSKRIVLLEAKLKDSEAQRQAAETTVVHFTDKLVDLTHVLKFWHGMRESEECKNAIRQLQRIIGNVRWGDAT